MREYTLVARLPATSYQGDILIARNNITSIILCALFFIVLSGCSQHYVAGNDGKQARAAPYAILSSGSPGASVASASTFALMTDRHEAHGESTLGGIPVNVFLDSAINTVMSEKGYRSSRVVYEHSLLVDYQLALGNPRDAEQLGNRYGMQPGLKTADLDAQRYKKGALVITVTDNRTGQVALRSVLEGFADLDIPAEVRQQRFNDIVARMLSKIPSRAR
jgi:hypothetical protein